ncbi:MAG: hypothetical protein ACTSRR_01310 [Candidatus Heimdallarchaeaceae archaeon]
MTTSEESIPSDKFLNLEKNKIVEGEILKETDKEKITLTPKTGKERSKLNLYFFSTEVILMIAGIVILILVSINPWLFFEHNLIINRDEYGTVISTSMYIGDLSPLALGLTTICLMFPLLNNYLYIFVLESEKRLKAYIIRSAINAIALSIMLAVKANGIYFKSNYSQAVFFAIYTLFGNFYLRTALLFTRRKSKSVLFSRIESASPAEIEWKKYNKISGYLAVILGIFMLQFIWLIYHLVIRPAKINKTKDQLIIEFLDFGQEVNCSKIALELAISLEEVIYRIKRLVFKEQITGEFTRYGFILHEIKNPKWFSNKVSEKYEAFILTVKMSEKEKHVNRFFDIAERKKISVDEFRRIFKIKNDYLISDFVLLLPPHAVKLRKNIVLGKQFLLFNYDLILMKRKQIKESLLYHFDEIFNLKITEKVKTKK